MIVPEVVVVIRVVVVVAFNGSLWERSASVVECMCCGFKLNLRHLSKTH